VWQHAQQVADSLDRHRQAATWQWGQVEEATGPVVVAVPVAAHQGCDALDDCLQCIVRDVDVIVGRVIDCRGWQRWGPARVQEVGQGGGCAWDGA
jgi:hypothetical protein